MKAKVIKTGEIVEVADYDDSKVIVYRNNKTEFFAQNEYRRDEIEFIPDTSGKVTIEGWIARDKGGGLYLHWERPLRGVLEWHTPFGNPRKLPQYSFPEVTWESEPLKVKLTLTPME